VTAARPILIHRNIRYCGISLGPPFNRRTCFPSNIGSSKWGYDSVYQISVYHCHHHIHHYNHLTRNAIDL
jgi:hypothetical protein